MIETARHVILIADRIANPDQAGTVRAYVERLGHRGFSARILCSSWSLPSRRGLDVEEFPGLSSPWRYAWVASNLRQPTGATRPALLHAMQARMAPAALEIGERWQVPYLQGVEEFVPVGSRLRVSRRWCRGLVATSRELGDDLIRGFGVPAERVHIVHRGLEPSEPRPALWASGLTPVSVIGAAGPLAHGSGFTTFLNAARRVLDAGVDAEFVLVGEGEGRRAT